MPAALAPAGACGLLRGPGATSSDRAATSWSAKAACRGAGWGPVQDFRRAAARPQAPPGRSWQAAPAAAAGAVLPAAAAGAAAAGSAAAAAAATHAIYPVVSSPWAALLNALGTLIGTAAPLLLDPASLFTALTVGVMPAYWLMIARPRSGLTLRLSKAAVPLLLLAGAYAHLLALAWRGPATLRLMFAETQFFLPVLPRIAALFQDPATVASAWAHLLTLDLLLARELFLDGAARNVPTAHSVGLCFMVGPLGLLSHVITAAVVGHRRRTRGAAPGGGGGSKGRGEGEEPEPVAPLGRL